MPLSKRGIPTVAVVVTLVAALGAGCGVTCKQVSSQYEKAKAAEIARTSGAGESAFSEPHFAVGVRTTLLQKLSERLVGGAIEKVVAASRSLDVAGAKPLAVESIPRVESLELDRREEACEHCFRISGDLGGTLEVDIPVLGKRKVPMSGDFQFVAPFDIGPGEQEGTGALYLDLGEAARENAAPIAISVSGLRDTWKHTIEKVLSSQLADNLLGKLEPVRLVSFDMPDFGLESVALSPAGLSIDPDGEAVRLLIATNLPVRNAPKAAALAAAAAPAADRNLGVAFPMELVVAGVAHGMRNGAIGRNYTLSGETRADGPVRVTLDSFTATAADADGPRDWNLDFRAFHLPDGGPCYWFDGRAAGDIAVDESTVDVTLDDVEFTDTSRSNLSLKVANWASAKFLRSGVRIARASLAGKNIKLADGEYTLSKLTVALKSGLVTLSALAR